MTEPTPGPWHVYAEHEGNRFDQNWQVVLDSQDRIVALCDEDLTIPEEERIANAEHIVKLHNEWLEA